MLLLRGFLGDLLTSKLMHSESVNLRLYFNKDHFNSADPYLILFYIQARITRMLITTYESQLSLALLHFQWARLENLRI